MEGLVHHGVAAPGDRPSLEQRISRIRPHRKAPKIRQLRIALSAAATTAMTRTSRRVSGADRSTRSSLTGTSSLGRREHRVMMQHEVVGLDGSYYAIALRSRHATHPLRLLARRGRL